MAGSLNRVMLIGNLGADPDVRKNSAGDPIVNMRIATTETWRDKNSGEKKEKTEWTQVVIFGGLAKVAEQYLKKGSKVYVSGSLQTRKWKDQQGNDRYSTEVVLQNFGGELIMLSGNGGSGDGESRSSDRSSERSSSSGGSSGGGTSSGGSRGGFSDEMSDEIPF